MRLRSLGVLAVGGLAALGPVLVASPAGAGVVRAGSAGSAGSVAGRAAPFLAGTTAPFLPGTTVLGAATSGGPANDVTSSNWSGYAVQAASAFTDVVGSWTQPAVSCTAATTYSSFWIGIDGYADTTVEQLGTEADCVHGSPVYRAWYELYPKAPVTFPDTVKPGDVLSAQVSRSGTRCPSRTRPRVGRTR